MSAKLRPTNHSIVEIEQHVGRRLEDVERDLILSTLTRCGGNRTWAADILGISVRTLRNKLQRYSDHFAKHGDKNSPSSDQQSDVNMTRLQAYDPEGLLPS